MLAVVEMSPGTMTKSGSKTASAIGDGWKLYLPQHIKIFVTHEMLVHSLLQRSTVIVDDSLIDIFKSATLYRPGAPRTNSKSRFTVNANALKKNTMVEYLNPLLPAGVASSHPLYGKVILLLEVTGDDGEVQQFCLLHKLTYKSRIWINPVDGRLRHGVYSRTWFPYTRMMEAKPVVGDLNDWSILVKLSSITNAVNVLPDCSIHCTRTMGPERVYYIM
jgi:hypothetical protein